MPLVNVSMTQGLAPIRQKPSNRRRTNTGGGPPGSESAWASAPIDAGMPTSGAVTESPV